MATNELKGEATRPSKKLEQAIAGSSGSAFPGEVPKGTTREYRWVFAGEPMEEIGWILKDLA
jgi:hypothetical protein